jgi:hypothetical protein
MLYTWKVRLPSEEDARAMAQWICRAGAARPA